MLSSVLAPAISPRLRDRIRIHPLMQIRYATYLVLSALVAVSLICNAAPAATCLRGADISCVAKELPQSNIESLNVWIDSVRRKHNIPAMGAIVFRADSILARGIAGVRRSNTTTPFEERDRFQLGSNTKAITATVLATLVEEGKISWTTTVADVFPELRESMSTEFRAVTIEMLLSHHAGILLSKTPTASRLDSPERLRGPIRRT